MRGEERELYDYSTHSGRLELHNSADKARWRSRCGPNCQRAFREELRGPLPPRLTEAHARGFADYFSTAQARRHGRGRAPLNAKGAAGVAERPGTRGLAPAWSGRIGPRGDRRFGDGGVRARSERATPLLSLKHRSPRPRC